MKTYKTTILAFASLALLSSVAFAGCEVRTGTQTGTSFTAVAVGVCSSAKGEENEHPLTPRLTHECEPKAKRS